jgi:hypothetical protein
MAYFLDIAEKSGVIGVVQAHKVKKAKSPANRCFLRRFWGAIEVLFLAS